jgi:hypothetical protein
MRVLVASQRAEVALEHQGLEHGFLTFALLESLAQPSLARVDATDRGVTLGEWLRYGERRVPVLAREFAEGERRGVVAKGLEEGETLEEGSAVPRGRAWTQRPRLFDLAKFRNLVVVLGKR